MNEKPILFSGQMVRAILEGRKTMTRRICKDENDKGRFEVGDRLWVRETHAPCIGGPFEPGNAVLYRADKCDYYEKLLWRPSIFMPRWASRITLEITGVRLERLQYITEDDAKSEGVEGIEPGEIFFNFQKLWNSIYSNSGYGWDANPWVCVVSFKCVEVK